MLVFKVGVFLYLCLNCVTTATLGSAFGIFVADRSQTAGCVSVNTVLQDPQVLACSVHLVCPLQMVLSGHS